MSFLDYFRQQYVKGKVIDKYSLSNGDIGLIVADSVSNNRYHVEFKDGYRGLGIDNLFGLLKNPFSGKTEYIDKLIGKGDLVELSVSHSTSPFREAYMIHSVYSAADGYMKRKTHDQSYKYFRLSQYKI